MVAGSKQFPVVKTGEKTFFGYGEKQKVFFGRDDEIIFLLRVR